MRLKTISIATLCLIVTLCGAQKKNTPYVILVSFDGFRYDYVKKFNPPHIKAFVSKGSQAEAMIPSFPSKTFPNHYSLVTGLHPGHHGLVDNQFYDSARKEIYRMKEKEKVVDPYYYGGVPLWELARQNGVKSASYFWVGSEMKIENRRPDYYFTFNDSIPPRLRIEQAINWLKLPEDKRPHFITLYFSFPDHEGHEYGPNSRQTEHAVLRADSLLGRLMKGIELLPFPVNVILVSDHGMRELTVKEETFVFIDELIDRTDPSVIVVNGGTQAHLYISNLKKRNALYAHLKSQEKNYSILKKADFPPHWNYQSYRTGDLLMVAKQGHYLREGDRHEFFNTAKIGSRIGVHGFDPETDADMWTIFYAYGPNIKSGITLKPFQNIHIYPLIAKILGLPLPPIDGKMEVSERLYVE